MVNSVNSTTHTKRSAPGSEANKPKKRNRSMLSCSICRQRKVKCDRGRPFCKVCEKHNMVHLCRYDNVKPGSVPVDPPISGIVLGSIMDSPQPPLMIPEVSIPEPIMHNDTSKQCSVLSEVRFIKNRISKLEYDLVHKKPHRISKQVHVMDEPRDGYVSSSTMGSSVSLCSYVPTETAAALCNKYKVNGNDVISIYEGTPSMLMWCSRMNRNGPLSWMSLVLKDPFLMHVFRTVSSFRKRDPLFPFSFCQLKSVPSTKKDADYKAHIVESSGIWDLQPVKDDKPNAGPFVPLRTKIVQVLPQKRVLWLLVDRWFLFLYPMMPILDKADFLTKIQRIIGTRDLRDESRVTSLTLDNRLDIATMASLLIVLQMAYLSLTGNNEQALDAYKHTETEQYLINHPVDEKAVSVAQECIVQFKIFKRCAINVFQSKALFSEYQRISGMESFSDGAPHIILGTLVQLAVSIGLNRDPGMFSQVAWSEKTSMIYRKLWYSLYYQDTVQSGTQGDPLVIRHDFFDTKLPVFSASSANTDDLEIEQEAIQYVRLQAEVAQKMRVVIDMVLNMNEPPTVGKLLEALDTFEGYIKERIGDLDDILTPTDGIHLHNLRKVHWLQLFLDAWSLLHPIYFHLMLYYEKRHNSGACLLLMRKSLTFVMKITSRFVDMTKYSYRFFGVGFDSYIIPTLVATIHKCMQIQITLYIRVVEILKNLSADNTDASKAMKVTIDKFLTSMMTKNFGESYMWGLVPIAERCFYGWLMMNASAFIFSLLQRDSFYSFPESGNFLHHVSVGQLRGLFDLASVNKFSHRAAEDFASQSNSSEAQNEVPTFLNQDMDKFWDEMFQSTPPQSINPEPPQSQSQPDYSLDVFANLFMMGGSTPNVLEDDEFPFNGCM